MSKTIKTSIILIAFLFLSSYPLILNSVHAQEESTDSANLEQIQKSLQDRIKKALNENLPEAEKTISALNNRAVIGIIDSLNQNQITVLVNPEKGDSQYRHQVTYSTASAMLRSNKKIQPKELIIGDYFIAIGQPISDSTLTADKIIVSTYTKPTINTDIVYATISKIDPDEDTITLNNSHEYLKKPLDITKNTDLFDSKHNKIDFDKLQINQKVVAVILINSTKKTVTLSSLFAFPQTETTKTPSPTKSDQNSSCGDGVCQNVACFGLDCPTPESPETCPADCTQ